MDGDVQLELLRTTACLSPPPLQRGCYSTVLVLTVSSFSTAVSPPSVQVVVMETLQETAVTWHTINARSHTAVMEYSADCIWVSVCDSLPQRGGIFFHLFLFFFSFFQEDKGSEASRLPKPTSAWKLVHVHCVLGVFACLFHAWRCRGRARCPGAELRKPETR